MFFGLCVYALAPYFRKRYYPEMTSILIPLPLPPDLPINWTPELRNKFDQALLVLGRLDSVSTLLSDRWLLSKTVITSFNESC